MMEITLTDFVVTLLLGAGLLVLLASSISAMLARQSERQSLQRRVICRLCLHSYEDGADSEISTCPKCHARNERGNRA